MTDTLFSFLVPGQYFTLDSTNSMIKNLLHRKISYCTFIEIDGSSDVSDELLRHVQKDFYVIPVANKEKFYAELTV